MNLVSALSHTTFKFFFFYQHGLLLKIDNRVFDPKHKRRLLQTWIAEGENRANCESRVVLLKESAQISKGKRALVSVRDMVLKYKWPESKIKNMTLKMSHWCNIGAPYRAP